MSEDKDPPIEEVGFIAGVNVIDIGDLRIARGLSRRPISICAHRPLMYDPRERRIWCKDCETNVDPFDAFVLITENFYHAAVKIERGLAEVEEAKSFSIRSIAAKKIDKIFRSRNMVPACPNCSEGILPEDVARMGRISKEWVLAKRRQKPKDE